MISGIRRDTDDTQNDGAILATNLRFVIDGEYRRRTGMELATAVSSDSIVSFWNPVNGTFALVVTPAGTWVSVAV